jgi:cupin domain
LGIPTVLRATGQATNGAFGLIEHLAVRPGFASPYHTHHSEDESFYILEGEMAVCCGGKWMMAGAGTFVFLPRLDITLAPGERRTLRTTFVAPAQGANVLAARVMLSPLRGDVMPQSDRNINNDTIARFIGPEPRPSRPCVAG